MSINNSQRAAWPKELSATMTGSTVLIGTLTQNPVLIIFDNQSTVSISISINDSSGSTVWRTFPAGEALVLDLRNQHGLAPNFTIDIGTSFYGTGASGTFSISYVYALNM
jgi:hypothetical protein